MPPELAINESTKPQPEIYNVNWSDRELGAGKEKFSLSGPDLLTPENNSIFKRAGNSAVEFAKEHPVACIIAGVGIVALAVKRPWAAEKIVADSVESATKTGAAAELRATGGLLRDAEKNAIPNIERPFLTSGSLEVDTMIGKAREAYAGDLIRLLERPHSAKALAGENLAQFSERVFKDRALLTKERLTAETASKELSRISGLNGGLAAEADVSAQMLKVSNPAHFAEVAAEMQFKHVPQIGQFMKASGQISEAQIQAALTEQGKNTSRRIGEILVDLAPASEKTAMQASVDLSFSTQNHMKAVLKDLREKFLFTVQH